jgi:hypothetical protein
MCSRAAGTEGLSDKSYVFSDKFSYDIKGNITNVNCEISNTEYCNIITMLKYSFVKANVPPDTIQRIKDALNSNVHI